MITHLAFLRSQSKATLKSIQILQLKVSYEINAEAITDVFIYDIIGTLQHTSQSMTMGEFIDVSHLNSGTYLIAAFFSDGNSKKSILILQ